MPKSLLKPINRYNLIPLFILLGFTLWFAYDIYTLKKCLTHADIYTYYYPYRQWFSQQLLNGEFPLWNPFWGIGQPVALWATIPLDIYTIPEIVFGPQYHYFQTAQLAVLLLVGFYAFVRLGFKPLVSAAGVLLFFLTPWVTYFYFYFVITSSYIAHILLFLFIFQWFSKGDKRYLFFILWTTIFSLFGTKLEFWFYQIVFYTFFCLMAGFFFNTRYPTRSLRAIALAISSMFIGVLAHVWQLNLLVRIMANAGRTIEHSISNLFSSEMYHNLFLSLIESPLLKIFCTGSLLYISLVVKKRFLKTLFLLCGLAAVWGLDIWNLPVMVSFIKSPLLNGAILGFLLSLLFSKERDWQNHVKAALLFLLFAYYWCRPERGDLNELGVMRTSPAAFKTLLSALVWLGCTQFTKNRLVKLAYFSILFVFVMRDHGQIILAYLAGILWVPTRDNYLIDFAFVVIAISGLTVLDFPGILVNRSRWIQKLDFTRLASFICIWVIVFSSSSNFYYTHSLMKNAPPDYPYYEGIPKLRKLISGLKDSPVTRVFFLNYDAWGFSYGFGSCLLEGVGQVSMYDSLIPKRYRDWVIYRNLRIRPEEKWGWYWGGYIPKTISRLPEMNSLGRNKWEIYRYTVIAQPPIEKNTLKFLGADYLMKMSPISGDLAFAVDRGEIDRKIKNLELRDIKEIKGVAWPGVTESLYTARLSDPLPRAFLVSGVSRENIKEFMDEMNPIVNDSNDVIKTKSYDFPLGPAKIDKYQPENVSIAVETEEESYLVLSDLYYPFWHARIDGEETEIIPAFYIFRAVRVPSGKHSINFYCKVPYFKTAVLFSLSVVFLSILAALRFKSYRRKNYSA